MNNEIELELQQELFKGNVLDIGVNNNGVIYNVHKYFNKDLEVEYINGKEEEKNIEKEYYDSCVLLFTLSNLYFKLNKRNLFKDIYDYLKKDGYIYIWDINKGYNKIFTSKVKILLPEQKVKEINVRDLNIFEDNSKETILKLLGEYFTVTELKEKKGLYYIKAQKKNNI